MRTASAAALLAALVTSSAWAFYPPEDTAGGVTFSIGVSSQSELLGEVKALGKPLAVSVVIGNKAATTATGQVTVKVTDDWTVQAPVARPFSVDAGKDATLSFSVTPGPHSYGLFYPIHAFAEFSVAGQKLAAHPILLVKVAEAIGYHEPWADAKPEKALVLPPGGALALDNHPCWQVSYQVHDQPAHALPVGFTGADQETGVTIILQAADRGGYKNGFGMHEPWRTGYGTMWLDIPVKLPDERVTLRFSTAIRDNNPDTEPPSDGVDFRVFASVQGTDDFRELFRRFSASKTWEAADVDLSAFRAKAIVLRLWQGPGPKNDTTCDSSYWGEPTLVTESRLRRTAGATDAALRQKAAVAAQAALTGKPGKTRWLLDSPAGKLGAAIVDGPTGLLDSAIAFAGEGGKSLVFDGYKIEIDGTPLGHWRSEMTVDSWKVAPTAGGLVYDYALSRQDQRVNVQVRAWAEKGGLRLAFSMPGVTRALNGKPMFTKLYLGRASAMVRRLYAGFGNVIVPKGPIDIWASGFQLSTRHAGADFEGGGGPAGSPGLSLTQACSIQPDEFQWAPAEQRCSLVAHHDCTITLVPSDRGAFAGARAFRDLAGYKPASGHQKLLGRMVIDQWGGEYGADAQDLRRAGAYGLSDALYLQHVWQRWGYDYRLPDIYPPSPGGGTRADFDDMVSAAKAAGMLFALHDNYIDFYPDATGFSYKHIIFNPDGKPQWAWWNPGPGAQSYRWLPHGFMPWLEANLKLVHDNIGATAYFVDVFSAIPLLDYYDQSGRFYTKVQCGEAWGHAFDRIREMLGNDAPTISEAGHDALIGHLDAGQADGFAANTWTQDLTDSERIPWHDMASHGSFILLGGGLGSRFDPDAAHQWGTDDYMSYTVLGGRNPMCDGPCNRGTVVTYYLLHDICDRLERASLESHEFAGDDIHRQHTTFSAGGQVWVNRGTTPWQVEGVTLPQYGFIAKAGDRTSEITLREGVAARMAVSPGVLYVDARPTFNDVGGRGPVRTRVTGGRVDGRHVTIDVEWEVLAPLPEGETIFVHVDHPKSDNGEKILFYGSCDLPVEDLQKPGRYEAHINIDVPDNAGDGANEVRYGLYHPKHGGRIVPLGDADSSRIRGGVINVSRQGDQIALITYNLGPPPATSPGVNAGATMIDFGPVSTNGAFRLLHSGEEWWLIPLPGSNPFEVAFDMAALGAPGKTFARIEGVDMAGRPLEERDVEGITDLSLAPGGPHYRLLNQAFKYRLVLGKQ